MANTKKKAKAPAKNNGVQSNVLRSKNGESKQKDYPHWNYQTKREWQRAVRKRWVAFRKTFDNTEVMLGSVYYPKEVYKSLCEMRDKVAKELDKQMREYYKNA